ncbi:MAG TPA: sugar ABC transporter ATP-binding protein [Burkholderiaceae bacterium]|nr:sugar ABC transporter ATP-binding protein [Burkholderiaceae bacterium]
MTTTNSAVLVATGLSKRYGGVQALEDVGFELHQGEIHGLCGENGAGKSTLVKILGGFVKPDTGEVCVDGVPLTLGRKVDPSLISIVHQELSIVPHLSVLDNVMLGAREVGAIYRRARFRGTVRQHLDAVGLGHVDLDAPAARLSLAEQQLVEIARGIARGARVLLLDEPTATLSDVEIERVFAVLRKLGNDGTTIVVISHRLDEIFALTQRVTVFRSGRHIFTRHTAELTSAELVRAMIGRDVARGVHEGRPERPRSDPPRLGLRGWRLAGVAGAFDLRFEAGEIVALVGQLGSGADALLESMAGLRRGVTGRLELNGQAVALHGIAGALRAGIAYVAEDRAGKGVFLDAPIGLNLVSQVLAEVSPGGWVSSRMVRGRARKLAGDFQLDPARLPHEVSTLSGGNQQKVSLGKAVAMGPCLLLLNEPTRGVDIGARSEIYAQLTQMTQEQGLTIVFYSTDLEEVMELADRVITIYRGSIVRDTRRSLLSADDVLHDMLHGAAQEVAA